MSIIKWEFPYKTDGSFDGFNDSGIETFRGRPYASLAREVLQNSLDAKDGNSEKPVVVTFELVDVKKEDVPGHPDLASIMKECLSQESSDDEAPDKKNVFFKNAVGILNKETIPCLKIDDYHTTGLRGGNERSSQWFAITKMTGESVKGDPTAGGSYGIGKNAPYATSDLRTVFYYTKYEDAGKTKQKLQGKSILMSRSNGMDTTQGTGYYGVAHQCQPIEDAESIPALFRERKETGTTILVLGFAYHKNWAHKIAAIVLSNFFYAVYSGLLEVVISSSTGRGKEEFCIDKQNLDDNFSKLSEDAGIDQEQLTSAKAYLDALNNGIADPVYKRETEDPDLGLCEIFIKKEQDFPQKVSIVRSTGMLITERLQKLRQFPRMPDFAAVLICTSEKGNAFLRKMENPQHDCFEPERLSTPKEKKRGKAALLRIAIWARKQLEILLGVTSTDKPTPLTELGHLLPNEDDETIRDPNEREKKFGGGLVISPKPQKVFDGHPSDSKEGKEGISGTSTGTDSESADRNRPSGSGQRVRLPIKGFKILETTGNRNKVVFTPQFSGSAEFDVYIAGDSTTEKMDVTEVLHKGKNIAKSGSRIVLKSCKAGDKVYLNISFKEAVPYPLAIELTKINKGEAS